MRILNRTFDKFLFISIALSSFSFFIIVILGVFSRYVLKAPMLSSIELSRLFFVWSCFLAAALTYRKKAHVQIEFIYTKLPSALRKVILVALHFLILAFWVMILYQSIVVTVLLWPSRLPMLQISQSWFYVPLPLISLILICYTMEFLRDDIASRSGSAK